MLQQQIRPIHCLLPVNAVAERCRARRPAGEPCVTPSTVGDRIRQIESQLRFKLLARSDFAFTAEPTGVGMRFGTGGSIDCEHRMTPPEQIPLPASPSHLGRCGSCASFETEEEVAQARLTRSPLVRTSARLPDRTHAWRARAEVAALAASVQHVYRRARHSCFRPDPPQQVLRRALKHRAWTR